MKPICYCLFFVLFLGKAQGSGEIQYVFINKGANYQTIGVLRFAENIAFYTTLKSDAVKERQVTYGDNNSVQIVLPDSEKRQEFYLNYKEGTLSHFTPRPNGITCLNEEIPKIGWKIVNEFKELGGYRCQKAVGRFRGRSYQAWFAPELPMPYGPWKLQGLPGTILEVLDSKNEIFFSVEKIVLGNQVEIEIPRADEYFDLKEYITVVRPKRFKEHMELMRAKNPDRNTVVTEVKMNRDKLLEVTYEWDTVDKKN